MDFDEPDLEELIQNDLKSEMNKILSQSEVEELEAAASIKIKEESRLSPHPSRNSHQMCEGNMAIKLEREDQERLLHGDFDVMESSLLQELNQHNSLPRCHPEISGHFAVGSYADFGGDLGPFAANVTEHSDLSSLTWLTTVDVQALQKLTEQGRAIPPSMIPVHGNTELQQEVQVDQDIPPEHRSVIHMAPTSNMRAAQESSIPRQLPHSSNQVPRPDTPSTSRYTPIQPHLSPEDRRFLAQQRYHLHQHPSGGPVGRNPFESGQIGPRRYVPGTMVGHHPYPPPPYATGGASRGAFLHGGSMVHSRFHHHHHHGQPQKVYPKPVYSYSCLIAMALYNSKTGCLPVSDIYSFMMENYPYFKTAPDGWKNSVRHNLSLNKCFEKVEKPNGSQRKGCLWALNPAKISKMKEEVQKWKRKDPDSIRRSMSHPEELDRELEEMRRSDEEAARRRMLSLSSHGLTAPGLHMHPHHQHNTQSQLHLHMHQQAALQQHMNSPTAGPSSGHATSQRHPGQHFSTELAQQNFALTLARSASQPASSSRNPFDLSNIGSPSPRVHAAPNYINLGSNNNNNSYSENPVTSPEMIVLTANSGKSALFTSTMSSTSSTSSTNTSLLGTMADVNNVLDDDLDASLADLAGLHESFWGGTLESHHVVPGDIGEVFSETETKSIIPSEVSEDSPMVTESRGPLPPVIRVLSTHSQESTRAIPGF